jgi:hypothetical protein
MTALSDPLLQVFASGGNDEFAVLYAAHGQHVIGEVLHFSAAAFHEDYFQAIVGVQMHVGGGEDVFVRVMLNFVEPIREMGAVVVVDHRKRGDDGLVAVNFIGDQAIANQIAESFGAILVAASGNPAIELFEQVFFDGNAGPG